MHGFLEQVAYLMTADLREPHEDGSVTSIVMSQVVSVRLLHEEGITRGKVDADKNSKWGRPVGVTVTPDGSVLVSDDGGNRIWRVRYKG